MSRRLLSSAFAVAALASVLSTGCCIQRPNILPRLFPPYGGCATCYPGHGGPAPAEFAPVAAGPVFGGAPAGCSTCGSSPVIGGGYPVNAYPPGIPAGAYPVGPPPAFGVPQPIGQAHPTGGVPTVMPSAYVNGIPYDSAIVPTVAPPKLDAPVEAKKATLASK